MALAVAGTNSLVARSRIGRLADRAAVGEAFSIARGPGPPRALEVEEDAVPPRHVKPES
jgi:hypothetical protein